MMPTLRFLIPAFRLKGLAIAALTAAIVASLAGKLNSISTIYTLDIHMKYFKRKTEAVTGESAEKKMVWVGKIAALASIALAVIFEWKDLLGISGEGGFTFIQKYTGFISPGSICDVHPRLIRKRTTGAAAVAGLINRLSAGDLLQQFCRTVIRLRTLLYTAYPNGKGGNEIPFLINMGWASFFTMVVMIGISLSGPKVNPKAFALDKEMFKLKPSIIRYDCGHPVYPYGTLCEILVRKEPGNILLKAVTFR